MSAQNILPFPMSDDPLQRLVEWHSDEIKGMLKDLLKGVPPEGGSANRETMVALLTCAFQSGALAQGMNPMPFNSEINQ